MAYKIIWEEKGVFVKFGISATGKEVIRIDDLLYSHDNFETIKYQLWDFTDSVDLLFTDEEMEIIGVLDKAASIWNRNMLVVIVTNNNAFRESIGLYQKQIQDIGWSCNVFENLELARLWIQNKIAVK